MNQDIQKIIRNILNDVRVELSDEFDRNFERQAFFNEAWQRRSSPIRPGGSILIDTGKLRQSISSRTTDSSITFCSTLPYAAIHNDGGEIKVTARMKRFFWHKYHEATGSFGRKKNGERRNDKRTVQLSTEAERASRYRAADFLEHRQKWSKRSRTSSRRTLQSILNTNIN